jgi:hypothetical protein
MSRILWRRQLTVHLQVHFSNTVKRQQYGRFHDNFSKMNLIFLRERPLSRLIKAQLLVKKLFYYLIEL